MPQDYKNEKRFTPTYHVLTALAVVALLVGSIRNMIYSGRENFYSASLLVLVSFIFISLYVHIRMFVNKVQDRAIRAEENLRYFILTGNPLDPRLTGKQISALHFASDEELPALAEKAVQQRLSTDKIKKEIKKWRTDNYQA